jgi:hypothetical protein
VPFVDTAEGRACLEQIEDVRPVRRHSRSSSALVDESVRSMLRRADALVLDFFGGSSTLEVEFGIVVMPWAVASVARNKSTRIGSRR